MKVIAEVEIGTGVEKGHFLETLVIIETIVVQAKEVQIRIKASTNRDRIRCYKCREYDQQMLNLDGEKTSLKSLVANTHDNLNKISSEEDLRLGHLNL